MQLQVAGKIAVSLPVKLQHTVLWLQGATYPFKDVQVVLCLTPDGFQLNLDPGHLPNAEALKHIQLDLGYDPSHAQLHQFQLRQLTTLTQLVRSVH